MKILLAIPHVFDPREKSLYSSQNESKRDIKTNALLEATLGNINRNSHSYWLHASLGKGRPVITRELSTKIGSDITIQIYTPPKANLTAAIPKDSRIKYIDPGVDNHKLIPLIASKELLLQAKDYDLVGYLEDDLLIEDPEFFHKLLYLNSKTNGSYAFLPHRCEKIPGKGDVILSGDPDGGRPDLFWDTGEEITIDWPLGNKVFYRATNPHSGCYFLTREQAIKVSEYWEERKWEASFQLSGPLEQAGSGLLLPILKIMKPITDHYRFLMVRHQDELWKRHPFEVKG